MIEIDPNNPPKTETLSGQEVKQRLIEKISSLDPNGFAFQSLWMEVFSSRETRLQCFGVDKFQLTTYHP